MHRVFLDFSIQQLNQMYSRIETCLDRLTVEQVWARGSENENAVGNLVLHLCGNVRQWIISGITGAEDKRDRDAEFDARGGQDIPELKQKLHDTIAEAAAIIDRLTVEQLMTVRVRQGYTVTNLEAIFHVVEHFSMHTGQVIFATKLMTQEDLGFYRHLSGNKAGGRSQERGI